MLSPVQQPYRQQIIHVRWSGEGLWIPLGDHDLHDLALENQTSHPAPGHIILYPGGISEARASLALEAQKPGADRLVSSAPRPNSCWRMEAWTSLARSGSSLGTIS